MKLKKELHNVRINKLYLQNRFKNHMQSNTKDLTIYMTRSNRQMSEKRNLQYHLGRH